MKREILFTIILLFLCNGFLKAQSIKGSVMDGSHRPIEGATVFWINTTKSAMTDSKGNFSLDSNGVIDKRIITQMLGYSTDTFMYQNKPIMIHLTKLVILKEADVSFEKSGVMISIQPIKTEIIGIKELKKAACCNLGESFETNATVDVTYKDALTGSKELQVLGLSGSYIQLLTENASLISGLGLTYGLNGVPGTQIEAINIVKGPGSVIFGPDAISGMINVDLHDPERSDTWFVNGYVDENLRREINVDRTIKINPDLNTYLSFHMDDMTRKVDENGDTFLDMPLVRNISFLNKWKYNNKRGLMSQFSYKYLYEKRMSGQTNFDYDRSYADMSAWGQKIGTNRFEIYGRTGYVLPTANYKSIGVQYSFAHHEQNGFYGIRRYDANQNLLNLRLIYNMELNQKHSVNIGLSLKAEDIKEQFDTINVDRSENTPGFFIEDTYKASPRLTFIIGYRMDKINSQLFHTPRINMKYAVTDQTDLRVSAGSGVRLAHVFAENPAFLVGSKAFNIDKNLKAEQAINYGANIVHSFTFLYRKGTFGIDLYRTEFLNRVRIDLDKDPLVVNVYSQANASYSNTFQTELTYKILKTVEMKLAYKYLDVQSNFNGAFIRDPYIARNRFLSTFSFESFNRKWKANLGINYVGSKRLPQTHSHFGMENLQLKSPGYTIINTQFTRTFKSWEVYVGAENLFDFKQMTHLLGSDDPYGPYFDAAYIWGPMDGRRAYAGFRYKFNK